MASAPLLRRVRALTEERVKCELAARDFLLEASPFKVVRGRLTGSAGRATTRITRYQVYIATQYRGGERGHSPPRFAGAA